MTVAKGEGVVGRMRGNGQQFEVDGEGGRFEELPDVWPPYSPNESWRGFLRLAPLLWGRHILPQGQYSFSAHVCPPWELIGGPIPVGYDGDSPEGHFRS